MTIVTDPPVTDALLVPQVHEVLAVVDETPGVVTLRVAPVDGPPRPFLPAQVGMVGAFGIGEAAISISSAITERDHHEYTIRRAGAITAGLTRLRPGDQLWVRGPFGTPWDLDLDGRDVIVAAGGIGLAPLRSALYELMRQRERYRQVALVVGARSSPVLLYAGHYERWREHGLAVFPTIDEPEPDWTGSVGFVHLVTGQVLDELGFEPARTSALVCGPDPMMTCTADLLVERGTPADQIQLTLERNMQCGNGLCGHCQLGPVVVCRDGPVVRYPAVAGALAVEEL
jgi:NAD(P)H-flavin reductase